MTHRFDLTNLQKKTTIKINKMNIALLAGILSVVGSIITAWSQQHTNERNIETAQSQMTLQQSLNEESADNATKRTEELYNKLYSPSAKLQQYKEAGLSPAMMYGGTGVGGTSSTSGAQANTGLVVPNLESFDFTNLGNSISQIAKQGEETKKTKAETERVETETTETQQKIQNLIAEEDKTKAEKLLTDQQTKQATIIANISEATKQDQKEKIQSEASLAYAENQKVYNEVQKLKKENEYVEELNKANLENLQEQNKKIVAETANIIANTQLTGVAQEKLKQEIENLKKTGDLLKFENAVNDEIGTLGKWAKIITSIISAMK